MIICEVLGVTPYELLAGTENCKMKEYTPCKDVDYVVDTLKNVVSRLREISSVNTEKGW